MAILMYFKHFGLEKNPFLLNTAPDCVYYSASHCEAIAQLLYAVRDCKGIALLMGEAGTGKTTLLHSVLNLVIPAGAVACTILNPMMETAEELLYSVLAGFKIDAGHRSSMELLDVLSGFLEEQAWQGRRALLLIDEAQQLSRRTLDNLRLISNLESNGQRLIQLILSAQPEIRQELSGDHYAALRQRIVARCYLETLQPSEVWNYLALRVARAGGDGRMIFQADAVEKLAALSCCIPRLINVLADNCLIAAFARKQEWIDSALVSSVASHFELSSDGISGVKPANNRREVERSPESWKKLVSGYASYELPEALQKFAGSLTLGRQVQ
jgi:general secretion pathway protein A